MRCGTDSGSAIWWCVDEQGCVVDASWKNEGVAYIGVKEVSLVDNARRIVDSGA